jgi:signal transduction histidine kinase
MRSLKTKLTLSYLMVIGLCILLISGLTNVFLDKHFREYVNQNREEVNRGIVNQLAGQYGKKGAWDYDDIEVTGVRALENGIIIKVRDITGTILWDATLHNNGMCQRIIEQMAQTVNQRYPFVKDAYTEKPYPIYSQLRKVGLVEIGSYGPYYLGEHELAFINTLNQVLMGVGIFSLIAALLLANFTANRLSTPILKVIRSAGSIEKGYYSDRITSTSDMTEINQLTSTINNLAETLEKQEALRKRLTGDLAHELRTPLATLQSHIEAMMDGIWEPDRDRLISCHEAVVRINRMVGDLGKLARFEGENLVLDRAHFDVTELVRRLVQNFQNEFLSKDIRVEIKGDEERTFADRDKMSQVFVNLLSNAQKYTPRGGSVTIHVSGDSMKTEITVEDNGEGISEEDLPYVFERFYRADKSRTRSTGGSGIGLTIAKAIVTAHSGTITVSSRKGHGTKFCITLPKNGQVTE